MPTVQDFADVVINKNLFSNRVMTEGSRESCDFYRRQLSVHCYDLQLMLQQFKNGCMEMLTSSKTEFDRVTTVVDQLTTLQSAEIEIRSQLKATSSELDSERQLTATLRTDILSLNDQKNRLTEQISELKKSVDSAIARSNELHRYNSNMFHTLQGHKTK